MALEDKLKSLPVHLRWILFVLLLILCVVAFLLLSYLPKQEQLVMLKQQVAALNKDVQEHQAKADRLEVLLKEKAEAEKQLAALQQELPLEPEAVALLKQIAELGVKSGLDFKLWRPGAAKSAANGLYVEYPVAIEVSGGYHAVAGFFDHIGRLQRIVNVTNIKMGSAKVSPLEVEIATTFSATAFASGAIKPADEAAKPKSRK
jgi:type IV pilus assembly protein PilO